MPQDIQSILDPLPVPSGVKADVWDAFHQAQTPEDFKAKLDGLQLPTNVKADLWDAKFAQTTPDVSVKLDYGNGAAPDTSAFGSAVEFGQHFASSANPVPVDLLKSIYQNGNIATAKGVFAAQGDLFNQARNAYHGGDYLTATRKTLEWLIPFLGPAISHAGDELQQGKTAAGIGDMLGLAAQPVVAGAIGKVGTAGKLAIESKLNPVQQAAVDFADRENIPLDAATRTGNETARAVQNVVGKQLGGSGVAADARAAQATALQQTAKTLQDRVVPGSTSTAETAGQGLRDTLDARAKDFNQQANAAYAKLRDIENRPENTVDVGDTASRKAVRAQEAFDQMVDQSVDARLQQIKDDVRSGSTEMTGKTRREYANPDDPFDVGPVTGRFAGGFKKSYSELSRVSANPGDIADAIGRGKGKLYDEVHKAVREAVLDNETGDIKQALKDVDLPVEQQLVKLPVDMRPVKATLQPLYNELTKRWPIAQQRASQGLTALKNILDGEDVLSASEADQDLSALKGLQREAKDARNLGLTTKAVKEMDLAVRGAVAKAGPEAVDALNAGRAATKEKYASVNLLDTLRQEPVQVFNQLTQRKDSQLNLLREVQRQAPDHLPKVGQAYLEGLFDTATQEGGFAKAGTISNKWDALGDESKQMMFQHPGLVSDLDNFFRIAKRLSENPNPSGTASTLAAHATVAELTSSGLMVFVNPAVGAAGLAAGGAYILGSRALAKLLFNPKAARAITEGLTIPISSTAARTSAATAYLLKLAGEQGQRVQQPAMQPAMAH